MKKDQMTYYNKLSRLRTAMATENIDAYLVPYTDRHQNEYLPPFAKRLHWLTGFDGSAGFCIVTQDKAVIFVDGRYTLQVQQQVDQNLFEVASFAKAEITKWLLKLLEQGGHVGIDPWLYTRREYKELSGALAPKGLTLISVPQNLIDFIWDDQPPEENNPLVLYDEKYAGKSREDKLQGLADFLQQNNANYVLLTQPESLCWLLNIRGRDVAFSPLVLCFGLISKTGHVDLFLNEEKIPPKAQKSLLPQVTCHSLEAFENHLKELSQEKVTVAIDPDTAPEHCFQLLEQERATSLLCCPDPCIWPKACKTPVEVRGAEKAHLKDGVALTKFLFWLEKTFEQGGESSSSLTELSAADKLLSFRQQQEHFQEPSFDTISGTGPHGAIVHYRVTPETDRPLQKGDLYLVDSGGQYLEGTTDVTRTVSLGKASSSFEKNAFTRVLKGHIALADAVFPEGTCGYQLDTLARQFLWQVGLDYAHGTGHGVGTYLGVHEGPQGISMAPRRVPLVDGMVVSNEPGYYLEGHFGIRIENLIVIEKASLNTESQLSQVSSSKTSFLRFKTLTLAPIDRSLIDVSLLTPDELSWFNAYHERVYQALSPYLESEEKAWLFQETRPL